MIDVLKAVLALLQFILEGRRASKDEQTARINFLNAQMEKHREAVKAAVHTGSVSDINRALSGLSDDTTEDQT